MECSGLAIAFTVAKSSEKLSAEATQAARIVAETPSHGFSSRAKESVTIKCRAQKMKP
jgi:hypothetical protein